MSSLGRTIVIAGGVALLWGACCLAIVQKAGIPEPSVHDEFGYLLGADTFAHGRLANPPHPLGRFFESAQILMFPNYGSKYPPGQSFALAIGQWFFGSAFYGVVISGVVLVFLIALTAGLWTSPLTGAAVAVAWGVTFLPPMYWTYSYWGGSVTAVGAAAVLLALVLFHREWPRAAGVAFAAGVLTLFLTRPYEGGVYIAVCAAAGALWLYRRGHRPAILSKLRTASLAAAPVLVAGLAWTGWYNAAVTGNPLKLPHLVHDAQYQTTPLFWFLPLRPDPVYHHPRLAAQYSSKGDEATAYKAERAGPIYAPFVSALRSLLPVFGWSLALLALVPFAWRDARVRYLLAGTIVCLFFSALTTFHFPHYAAPLVAPVTVMMACAAERLWNARVQSAAVGRIPVVMAFAVACLWPLGTVVHTIHYGTAHPTLGDLRADLIRKVSAIDGKHLIVVQYPQPSWRIVNEWVYNTADIDSQRVIFAHDLGYQQNEPLLRYYDNRRIWLLTFGETRYFFEAYPR